MKRNLRSLTLAICLTLSLTAPALAANVDCHVTAASGGMGHTLALKPDGSVWAWGSNEQLQLGKSADVAVSQKAVEVEGLTSVTEVAAGYDFSAALRYDGQVYAWGGGAHEEPMAVSGLSNIVAIDAGQAAALALRSDGTVWQWGIGAPAKQVSGLRSVAAISAGGGHFLALTTSGEVWAWGSNTKGQLGDGTTDDAAAPKRVEGLANIVDVAAGFSHSLAVDFRGNVYAWGSNAYGELGNGKKEDSAVPVAVSSLKSAVQVSAGNESSMAVTKDGKLYTWGYGEYGQLGSGGTDMSRTKPAQVNLQEKVSTVSSGVYHNLFLNDSGFLYAFGRNKTGQIGSSQNSNVTAPARILQVAKVEDYPTNVLDGVSSWATEEISAFYDKELAPPLLWRDYQGNITRAELAHLLVSVYEQVKGSSVPAARDVDFSDLKGHLLENDVLKACQLGFISGVTGTKMFPDNQVTRQEAAKMLCSFVAKMKNTTVSDKVPNLAFYEDAADIAEWAAPYVAYAYQNNIMRGTGDYFQPTASFTHEQSLLTIARLVEKNDWKAR